MYKFIPLTLLFVITFIIGYNFLQDPILEEEKIYSNPNFENLIYTQKDTLNIKLHYRNLEYHYDKPFFQNTPFGYAFRDDNQIKNYYKNNYFFAKDSVAAAIGTLSEMYYKNRKNNSRIAREMIDEIGILNPDLLFEIGLSYENEKNYNAAIVYYNKVLNEDSNYTKGVQHLTNLYFGIKNYDKAIELYRKYPSIDHPYYLKKTLTFLDHDYLNYLIIAFSYLDNSIYTILCIICGFIWLYYFNNLSLYKLKHKPTILTIIILSILFNILTPMLYDTFYFYFDFHPNCRPFNDFLFSIFGIGLIEESIKFIPILITILLFKPKRNYEILLITVISALIFSVDENILKLKHDNTDILLVRTMLCIPIHIALSLLISYGSYIKNNLKFSFKYFIIFFFTSITLHGLYDVFIINKYLSIFSLFSYFIAYFLFICIKKILTYTLNLDYGNNNIIIKDQNKQSILSFYFINIFSALFWFMFIYSLITEGYNNAMDTFYYNIIGFIILLVAITIQLSDIYIIKNYKLNIFNLTNIWKDRNLLNNKFYIESITNKKSINPFKDNLYQTSEQIMIDGNPNYIKTFCINPYKDFFHFLIKPYKVLHEKGQTYYLAYLYGNKSKRDQIYKEDLFPISKVKLIAEKPISSPVKDKFMKLSANKITAIFIIGGLISLIFIIIFFNYYFAYGAIKNNEVYLKNNQINDASERIAYAKYKYPDLKYIYIQEAQLDYHTNSISSAIAILTEKYEPTTTNEKLLKDYLFCKYNLSLLNTKKNNTHWSGYIFSKSIPETKKIINSLLTKFNQKDSLYVLLARIHNMENNTKELINNIENCSFNITQISNLEIKKMYYSALYRAMKFDKLLKFLENEKYTYDSDIYYLKLKTYAQLERYEETCNSITFLTNRKYYPAIDLENTICYSYKMSLIDDSISNISDTIYTLKDIEVE